MPVLKLFKALKPDQFSSSTYSAVVDGLDTTSWSPGNLFDFCLDQIDFFAVGDDVDSILLWSIFLKYCKENNAEAFVTTDSEGDELFAVVFTDTTTDPDGNPVTTKQALVFDQEKTTVTPPDQGELNNIGDLIKKALGG